MMERDAKAESRLKPSIQVEVEGNNQPKDLPGIPPQPDLSMKRDLQAYSDTFTPLNLPKNQNNFQETNTGTTSFFKPQNRSLMHQIPREERHNSNPNECNLSIISQVHTRSNETIANCSTGFTTEQLQRLFFTSKKRSSNKLRNISLQKHKFKLDRPLTHVEKGILISDTSSENDHFCCQSSPNLLEVIEEVEEVSPSLVEVSGSNPNECNLSIISQVSTKSNETIANCSTGFTTEQLQRLFSTSKKRSSNKLRNISLQKHKFKLDRPPTHVEKGILISDTSSENDQFRCHSSSNLLEVIEEVEEVSPSLVEVSGSNPNECNLSIISQVHTKSNETIANCSTGFTTEQLQRLFSPSRRLFSTSKKRSSNKLTNISLQKHKFKLDRPPTHVEKGSLISDTSSENDQFRCHSSSNLLEVIEEVEEVSPSLVEVSGSNPNECNLSIISQVPTKSNETIANCSTGFTTEQLQRLFSTSKKRSSNKLRNISLQKHKFKLDRPLTHVEKGILISDTSSENDLFHFHSSPNLLEVIEEVEEVSPSLVEVSGSNPNECNLSIISQVPTKSNETTANCSTGFTTEQLQRLFSPSKKRSSNKLGNISLQKHKFKLDRPPTHVEKGILISDTSSENDLFRCHSLSNLLEVIEEVEEVSPSLVEVSGIISLEPKHTSLRLDRSHIDNTIELGPKKSIDAKPLQTSAAEIMRRQTKLKSRIPVPVKKTSSIEKIINEKSVPPVALKKTSTNKKIINRFKRV